MRGVVLGERATLDVRRVRGVVAVVVVAVVVVVVVGACADAVLRNSDAAGAASDVRFAALGVVVVDVVVVVVVVVVADGTKSNTLAAFSVAVARMRSSIVRSNCTDISSRCSGIAPRLRFAGGTLSFSTLLSHAVIIVVDDVGSSHAVIVIVVDVGVKRGDDALAMLRRVESERRATGRSGERCCCCCCIGECV